jgi:hypothetical protein
VTLVDDDDVIQTFAADRADNAFDKGIIKSSQLHLFRLIERRPSRSLMSSIPFTGVSSRS